MVAKNKNGKKPEVCLIKTRRQKFWGVVALGLLFICGVMVGLGFNVRQDSVSIKHGLINPSVSVVELLNGVVGLSVSQTVDVAVEDGVKISDVKVSEDVAGMKIRTTCTDFEVGKDCKIIFDYSPKEEQGKKEVFVDIVGEKDGRVYKERIVLAYSATKDDTCVVIEEMFLGRLVPEYAEDYRAHEYNIKIYQTLIEHGCPENVEKYNMMIAREQEILSAFKLNKTTCGEIENLLQEQMPSADGFAENRIMRAKIYANLAERGCAENSDMYVKLAQKELEIARALKDDEFNRNDTIEVVETYKRLDMQAAAEEVFEKAKKLTNPAIDFILEIEKIINE